MSPKLHAWLIVPALMAVVSASVWGAEPAFVLVRHGGPQAVIVMGDKATRTRAPCGG